ncbi:hypothetical protein OAF98_01285 [Planctomicrobium sp.]|nr:hypothetical protein [Planctomicrobium sp.]MDA7527748.1 hypothetical protein [bacterium]MDB4743094.1 hypothetical protein [Planctomicrobium sp.]
MLNRFLYSSLLSLAVLTTVSAQDSALELYGSDVDVVLRLAEPDKSIESVVELINGAQPGFGEIARGAIGQNLGQVISNPTLTGVDQSRDWHVGVYGNGKAEPLVVFAIPAVDTDDLVGGLGEDFKSSVHGKYVLYTDKGDLPEVPAVEESVAKSMGEESKTAFEMGEISLYVNSKHLTATYQEEMETAYDQVLEGLNQLRFAMPQDAGINMGPIIEMYGALAEKLFQGAKDSESVVVAIDVGAEGVRIEEYVNFGAKTKSAKSLASLPTSEMADLGKLPEDAIAYYGVSGGLKDTFKWSMSFTADMSEDKSVREKMKEISTSLDEIEFGAMVGSFTIGDPENGAIQATGIAHVKPLDLFKKHMRSSVEAMGSLELPGLTQTSTLEEEAESYGEQKVDIVTVKQEFDADQPQAELQARMQEMMFGSNGIESRVMYLDDKYITVMGGGKAAAKKVFESFEGTSNQTLASPREILMEKAYFIGLMDLPGAIAGGLKVASTMDQFPLPLDEQMIDSLGLVPSYIGLGIAVEDNAIRCRTDIPMSQIKGIFKISMLFVGMRNQL